VQRTTIPRGSTLYLFSDGVFEIETGDDQRWTREDFLPSSRRRSHRTGKPNRIYEAVKQAARPGPLDDDFSLMVVTFP
jgi:serine phosphatase RsbU (regulator of sigma subunit)